MEKGIQGETFWRVEGSLLNLTAVRPVGFFAWNAQSFLERWARRGAMGTMAVARPALYCTHRVMATRLLHAVLRGVSRDRLDLLGEEYFEYKLKPELKTSGVALLGEAMERGENVILVSQGLDHVMRPLAKHLGVERLIANHMEFRDGFATGRLVEPVIRPRGIFARFTGNQPSGRRDAARMTQDLGFAGNYELLGRAIRSAERPSAKVKLPVVDYKTDARKERLSVREALRGKNILLIGGTGFIGKVWLAHLLTHVPEAGRVTLLVRRNRLRTAWQRFQMAVEESPVFEPLHEKYGAGFGKFLSERVEVVEGDASREGLGIERATRERLEKTLDLVVNSSGLTDFNPDLREALAGNVRAAANLVEFLRACEHAALLHLSTCYVAGMRDGRIREEVTPDYSPKERAGFDAEKEWQRLENLVRETEALAESAELTAELRKHAVEKEHAAKDLRGAALENQIRKNRVRWLRESLTEAGTRRAQELGWPNTYTFTKSLAESLLARRGADLPIAVVRPAIVESSLEIPFRGWNEGINTSASLSYLLGTYFRQLPTNERKCLDIIPVDLVTQGMMLIAAALVERRHERVYQLATSVSNPCNMGRSIELTGLAHRKHYRAQDGFQHWLRTKFDAIPVSKERYKRLSAPAQKAIVQIINRSATTLRLPKPPMARRERELERTIKLIELFEPFILQNEYVFEADNIARLDEALPAEERATFGYDAQAVDWWDYWINVHIPALRKWSYPLIEGRALEARPRREIQMSAEMRPVEETARAEIGRTAPASGS
ncbi:MAG: SDR family oxidoreductase [Candidatus Acidiferrales bacterium]